MTLGLALLAAVSGYVIGSIPFALIVVRLFGGGERLQAASLRVPGSDHCLRTDAVSATTVRLQLGTRYGCLTSLLDMAKAAAITLAFRIAFPQDLYFLIASGFCVVGHVWPVFNRFRGGRGQSPAIGGLLVIDWTTPIIIYPLGQLLGLVTKSRGIVGRFAPMLIAAGWLYFRTQEPAFIAYGLGLFAVRVIAMSTELRQYLAIRKDGGLSSVSDELGLLGYDKLLAGLRTRLRGLADPFRKRRSG